jgi:hypothetical protein
VADGALDVLLGLQDRDSRYRSSVIATLETALDPWLEPSVAHATTRHGDISADWLLDGPTPCTSPPPPMTSTASAACSPR